MRRVGLTMVWKRPLLAAVAWLALGGAGLAETVPAAPDRTEGRGPFGRLILQGISTVSFELMIRHPCREVAQRPDYQTPYGFNQDQFVRPTGGIGGRLVQSLASNQFIGGLF